MKTRNILIGLGITAIAFCAYFGIRYYNKRKKQQEEDANKEADMKAKSVSGTSTEEQFNRFLINAFRTENPNAAYGGYKKSDYISAKPSFLKNLSYNDGDMIALIASMTSDPKTLPEKQKNTVVEIINKWFDKK